MSGSAWLFRCLACQHPFEDNAYPRDSDRAWCPRCDRVVFVEPLHFVMVREHGLGECPRCGNSYSAVTRRDLPYAIPPELQPGPGDGVICFRCALPAIVGDDGVVRSMNAEEVAAFARDKTFCNVLRTAMNRVMGMKLNCEPL